MHFFRSWRALLVREFIEHRIPFLYFPVGILTLFVLSTGSGLAYNRFRFPEELHLGAPLKLFEVGYLVQIALWLAYTGIALFFYFGDAFSADRRNNAMLFWKSMPVGDLKIMGSKFLAGVTFLPFIILVIGMVSGVIFLILLNVASLSAPVVPVPNPVQALLSFANISLFAIVYYFMAMLWYAPFLAWVAGLSTVFGRWSLPLAFAIPGVLIAMENMVAFAQIPRGGYIWGYLSHRWQFGLSDTQWTFMVAAPIPFDVRTYSWLLFQQINWTSMISGIVFAIVVTWLASEYRRRRIA
jgi:ABC-2 type transport system permease protein